MRELAPGDRVLVRPGERLPTDGMVISGASAIAQSAVTGESIPVEVTAAATFGGTVNGTGALELRVTRLYEDTTLARVIRQVEEAQANKGTAQRLAERFGARSTPAVVAIADGVAMIGRLAGASAREWIYRALVVLVVSCSCALVISVPTAVVAAVTRGARDGVLIRGGAFSKRWRRSAPSRSTRPAPLPKGAPRLTDVVSLNGVDETEVLRLAAAAPAEVAIEQARRARACPHDAPTENARPFLIVPPGAMDRRRRRYGSAFRSRLR